MPKITNVAPGGGGGGLGSGTKTKVFNTVYDIRAAQTEVGDTAAETDLVSVNVVGGTIPATGALRWWFLVNTDTTVAINGLHIRLYFGGTKFADHQYGVAATGTSDYAHWGYIQNLDDAAIQEAYTETVIASTPGIYGGGNTGAPKPTTWQGTWFKLTKATGSDQIWKATIQWNLAPGRDPSARSLVSYLEILK